MRTRPTPNQNNHGINTVCFHVADFSTLVSSAWNHEGLHLNAAEQEAQQANNNLYALWEPIVRSDSLEAFLAATSVQNSFHQRVSTAALSTHTGATSNHSIWYHTGSGIWQWSTITLQH